MKDPTLTEHESIFGARIQTPDVVAAGGPGDWAPGRRHRLLAKQRLPNLEYTNAACHLHRRPGKQLRAPWDRALHLAQEIFK